MPRRARDLKRFHYAGESGILFLGETEMLLTRSDLFAPVDHQLRIFEGSQRAGASGSRLPATTGTIKTIHDGASFQMCGVAFDAIPCSIIVEATGALAQYAERARSMFGLVPPTSGAPSTNWVVMPSRRLRSVIQPLRRSGGPCS
jgi:hypothetical protein